MSYTEYRTFNAVQPSENDGSRSKLPAAEASRNAGNARTNRSLNNDKSFATLLAGQTTGQAIWYRCTVTRFFPRSLTCRSSLEVTSTAFDRKEHIWILISIKARSSSCSTCDCGGSYPSYTPSFYHRTLSVRPHYTVAASDRDLMSRWQGGAATPCVPHFISSAKKPCPSEGTKTGGRAGGPENGNIISSPP